MWRGLRLQLSLIGILGAFSPSSGEVYKTLEDECPSAFIYITF